MNKHRKNGVKRDHRMIQGLEAALAPVTNLDCVSACIPGRMRQARSRAGAFLTAQADTPDGLKLAAHGKGIIQDVFVITTDREAVRKLLK